MILPTLCTPIDDISTTLAVAYTAGSGTMTVVSAAGLGTPSSGSPVRIVVVSGTNYCNYLISGISGNVLTVAVHDGKTDQNFPSGATVGVVIAAGTVSDIHAYLTAGIQGPQGATGNQGTPSTVPGPQGATGNQGSVGSNGSQGFQGNQGFQGANGAQGNQGFQGNQGNQGTQGSNGAQGNQGFQGNQGNQGASGGGGSPGGSSGQIQYNNSGALGGFSNLQWSDSNKQLGIGGSAITGSMVTLNQTSGAQGLYFTGQPFVGSATGGGMVLMLGVNGGNNKQIWFVDADQIGNSTYPCFRVILVNGTPVLDAASSDGLTRKDMAFGSDTTNVSFGLTVGNTIPTAAKAFVQLEYNKSFVVFGASGQSADLQQWQNSSGAVQTNIDANGYTFPRPIIFVLGSGTPCTVGANLTNQVMIERNGKIVKAYINAKTAPTGSALIVDILKNGTSIWNVNTGNRLQIAASATSGTQTSFDTTTVAEGDLFSINIAQVGSTIAGQDVTVQLLCILRNQ
jgi:hypothetical protein